MESETEEECSSELGVSSDYSKNILFVKGPPFNPAEYMVSPSVSDVITKDQILTKRKTLKPFDLKIEPNPFDAQKALKKLKNLLRDKFGRSHVKRQRNLVRYIVRGMSTGFHIEDISSITEIIEYFAFNFTTVPEYIDFLNMILEIAVHPPKILRSSDVLNCKKELSNYFTMFGELLAALDDVCIQERVLGILTSLLVRPVPTDVTCIKLQYCHSAIGESMLPFIVASMLETVCQEMYGRYLEIASQIAIVSKKSCISMIEAGAMEFILWRLDPRYCIREKHIPPADIQNTDAGDIETDGEEYYKIMNAVGHLMWLFLDTIVACNVVCNAPTQNALWSLRYVLHAETRKDSKEAISLRNNLVGIAVKLYVVFREKLPLVQSGLAVDIAMLAVATELGTKNTWAKNINFGSSEADFILKKITMLCCYEMAKDINVWGILREQNVIEGFLHLINPDLTTLSSPWKPSQSFHLLVLALPILSELVPALPDVYINNKGNTRLLKALEWFMDDHFDKFPLLEMLSTLCTLATCVNNTAIIQDLKEQNGVKTVLKICICVLESQALKRDQQDKLTRIFVTLEKLCKNEIKMQACLGNMYVAVCIKFLSRVLKNYEEDSKFDPRLLIAFSGFLWEAVVWCPTLLRAFSEQRGIYLLLDLMEISSYPVQIIFLGLLVDMADAGDTLTHLLTWRDKNGYGILNTLIKIWKKEETLYKVPRTQSGCIADVERPLMTDEQWYLTHCVKNVHMFSPAIAEMMCNARSKIHSLYQLLRQRYLDATKLNESLYSISFSTVQPQNQVYIPLIEHFLVLKLGEVWFEVYRDVLLSGLVPSYCETEALSSLLEQKNRWAYRLKKMQEEIVALQKVNALDHEVKLYRLIRSCCLPSSLDALHELDFITRTSCKDVQIWNKRNQLKEIEGSLNPPSKIDDTHIHRTVVRDTNVSYLCGKYVWFKSEREVLPQRTVMESVSPVMSSCKIENL
ncbi:UNVERIFIED_CONTAM: hypothetical protein PYX00_005062 [Menopon gallinae]|uniref:Cilia- and flagella-associated protein 69 ARM repeats domain-containing protein n=1 Tax=Menopon gallinae TaxID=328185 RepID=A0AAW2HQ00_9NEOP